MNFLEHVVSQGGIAVNPSKIEAVMNWERLTSVTQTRRYLGLASYYRRIIKGIFLDIFTFNQANKEGCLILCGLWIVRKVFKS